MQYFFPSGPTNVIRFESGTVAAASLGVVVVGAAALVKGVVVVAVAAKGNAVVNGDCGRAKDGGPVAGDHCGRGFTCCEPAGKTWTGPFERGGANRGKEGRIKAGFVAERVTSVDE